LLRWSGVDTLLQGKKLFRTEGFVVDHGSRLNQVLKVSPGQEISEVHKLAVVGVFYIDYSPAIFAATDSLAINDNLTLRPHDCERNDVPDRFVESGLLFVIFIRVEWVESDVMVD
jgi:hypothetical protein